jgi:DNA-binding NarL/FixJ family response regulator
MAAAPSVVIAHDDDLIRDLLGLACAQGGVTVVGEALSVDQLLFSCIGSRPDVILIADRLGGTLVEEALPAVVRTGIRTVVLSSDPSPERMSRLLARDLHGYLSHDASPDEVAAAIRAVARGEVAVNPEVLSTILHQWRRLRSQPVSVGSRRRPVLTPRELDILGAMSDGLAAKAIALRLGVALKTVENHKIRIFEKLGVRSHAHAVTVAMAYGLARPSPEEPNDTGDE